MKKKKLDWPTTKILSLGFALIIFLGAILLLLPISSRGGETSFLDALFTATSATCVTGLVVADTYQHWTMFGQLVILALIQIGGLGFMTIGVYISVLLKRKIGLKERENIHESVSTLEIAGVVRLVRFIIRGTVLIEATGAILLAIRFIPSKGLLKGIYYGIFHSISAFCNAGFDLMGDTQEYSSFVSYESDPIVNITIMGLIIIGGIGFIVWDDLKCNKFHFRKYLLHTKIVLITTFALVFGGGLLFLILENNATLQGLSWDGKIWGALFSSVTARTAGFNTTDTAALTNGGKLLTIVLMFIGGSSGSTAGGIKTTTLVVAIFFARNMITRTQGTNILGRRLEDETLKKANAVVIINLTLASVAAFIIFAVQPFQFEDVLFEVFSAIGTVGMTTGITRDLNVVSRIVIILLMYCGRLGSLSFALTFAQRKIVPPVQQPAEKIVVG
ncbi:MAG: TrkH family potassium uptake protein [Lachnospiraceae bacterium]|nr:TrkH family potassium uptake protein [Lachnospiraceae bacterium]